MTQRERFLSPMSRQDGQQDAAILQSAFSDDVMIRQGKALLKPSEIRNRTPGKKRQKDWGECPLTFDAIKEPVRAADGNVYERWAIKKWLEENGNRSPLTNVIISPDLTPLQDSDEGSVKGSRYISPDKSKEGVKTEINTVLNTVRDAPGVDIDESRYVDIPSKPSSPRPLAPTTRPHGLTALLKVDSQGVGGAGGKGSSSQGAGAPDPVDRNKMIADLMRDTSLTPTERNAKIQAIRAGKDISADPPKNKPPLPTQAASMPAAAADPAWPPRAGAAGPAHRGQTNFMPPGSVSEATQRERDHDELRGRDADVKRREQLNARGFSGVHPSQFANESDIPPDGGGMHGSLFCVGWW